MTAVPPTPPTEAQVAERLQAALMAHRAGWLDDAAHHYAAVLAAAPEHPEALHHLGLVWHRQGRDAEALALIRRSIALVPGALAWRFNLAGVLEARGEADAAEAVYREAAAGDSRPLPERLDQARGLLERGQPLAAYHQARLARAAAPEDAVPSRLLGRIALARGRAAEALEHLERALALAPDDVPARFMRGRALEAAGDSGAARAAYEALLAGLPAHREAGLALAALHQRASRLERAAETCRAVLRHHPGAARAHALLGTVLAAAYRLDEAERHYREAMRHIPNNAALHCDLAGVLLNLGRGAEAAGHCRTALRLDPGLAEARATLGNLRFEAMAYREAERHYREALRLQPANGHVRVNLGNALLRQCRVEEAWEAYGEAVQRDPQHWMAWSNWLLTQNYRRRTDEPEFVAAHRRFGTALQAAVPAPAPHGNRPEPERPLRIGFLSSHLHTNPVTVFLEPWFRHRDRERFTLICYASGGRRDAVTRRWEALADDFVRVTGLSDDEAAERMRADGIDVLFDMAGHVGQNRLPLVARRPAPVVVTYQAYLNTTGLGRIDWFLSDAALTPPGSERCFTERVYRLERFLMCYQPPDDAPPVAPPPLGQGGAVTFGSYNNAAKFSPDTVRVWARLLAEVPGARLVLRSLNALEPETVAGLKERFASEGADPGRIEYRPPTPQHRDYLADYGHIDIALDPFPYNGVTTTCDALWMGVPVVTLAGSHGFGRAGASILTSLGRPEWIAGDEAGYVATARALAADLPRLEAERRGLRAAMAASPVADGPRFARDMEAACRDMWRRWCADRAAGTP